MDDDTDWTLISFEQPKRVDAPAPALKSCPKCGKALGRGGHFHVRACDGDPRNAG
jgi:hypothetical protein